MKKPDLYAYLDSKKSPLAAHVNDIYAAANKYRIDPKLLVAIAGAESSFGLYNSGSHNAWGIGPGRSYGSWSEGITAAAKLLREGYVGQGLTSLRKIQTKWAPIAASNDPRNLNSNWLRNTSAIYAELGGNPGTVAKDFKTEISPAQKENVEFEESSIFDIRPPGSPYVSEAPTLLDVATGRADPTDVLQSLLYEPGPSFQAPELPQAPAISPATPAAVPGGKQLQGMDKLNPALAQFAKQWNLLVTSGYRSVAEQKQIYSQGGVAAKPGSSFHNFGRAIDVAPNDAAMKFVAYARKNPGLFREVFYDGGNGPSIYIKNGVLYPGKVLGGHSDHVHIAR